MTAGKGDNLAPSHIPPPRGGKEKRPGKLEKNKSKTNGFPPAQEGRGYYEFPSSLE
jgi:hypothetical protein